MITLSSLFLSIGDVLANIIRYLNDNNELIHTLDGSGDSFIPNQEPASPVNDLLLYTGENIEVGVTNLYEIPLVTGPENFTNPVFAGGITGWLAGSVTGTAGVVTAESPSLIKIVNTGASNSSAYQYVTGLTIGNDYVFRISPESYSSGFGIAISGATIDASSDVDFVSTTTNSLSFTATRTDYYFHMYPTGAVDLFELIVSKATLVEFPTQEQTVCIYNAATPGWEYDDIHTDIVHKISTGTFGHQIVLAVMPSAADKLIMDAFPNVLLDLWFGRATDLTSVVKADILRYYVPSLAQGGYMVDLCEDLTENLVVNGDFSINSLTGWTGPANGSISWVDDGGGEGHMYINAGPFNRSCYYTLPVRPAAGEVLWLKIDYSRQSSSQYTQIRINSTVGTEYITAVGSSNFDHVMALEGEMTTFFLETAGNQHGTVDNATVVVVKNAIRIPNYISTMYTNVNQSRRGNQTSSILSKGRVVTGVDYSILQFHKREGYADTQWIPDGGFILQIVQDFKVDGLNHLNGRKDVLEIGESSTGSVMSRYSLVVLDEPTILSRGLHCIGLKHFGVSHPTTPNRLELWVDGIMVKTLVDVFPGLPTASFFVGKRTDGFPLDGAVSAPYIETGTSAVETDMALLYQDTKLVYTTLP